MSHPHTVTSVSPFARPPSLRSFQATAQVTGKAARRQLDQLEMIAVLVPWLLCSSVVVW